MGRGSGPERLQLFNHKDTEKTLTRIAIASFIARETDLNPVS